MAIYSLRDILISIKDILSLLDRGHARDERITEALVSIQTAIIETKKHINSVGYETNTDLSKLWFDSFDKIKKSRIYHDNEFPEFLYQKARFWGNPSEWLAEPSALELVPTLNRLENECDHILRSLK